jgi:hypothetical protein
MLTRRRRVLEHLIARGILTEAQVAQSQGEHHVRPSPVVEAIGNNSGLPIVDVRTARIAPELWQLVPLDFAAKHVIAPLERSPNILTLAMADPTNLFAIDDVKFLTGLDIDVVVADEQDLLAVIQAQRERERQQGRAPELVCLLPPSLETDVPVVKLVNAIILDAVKKRAREIVIEPRACDASVWFAVGDHMHEAMKPPKVLLPAMVDRVRAMGRGVDWFTLKDVIDVDTRAFTTRFGTQLSLRLFTRGEVQPLCDTDSLALPAFADAARIEPAAPHAEGRVDLRTALGWRATWTYPMSRHARLVEQARQMANVDVTDDECANGVRLFLRKRS